jgi:hypothetical protein
VYYASGAARLRRLELRQARLEHTRGTNCRPGRSTGLSTGTPIASTASWAWQPSAVGASVSTSRAASSGGRGNQRTAHVAPTCGEGEVPPAWCYSALPDEQRLAEQLPHRRAPLRRAVAQ